MEYFKLNHDNIEEGLNALINLHGRTPKTEFKNHLTGWSENVKSKVDEIIETLYSRNFNIDDFIVEFHLDVKKGIIGISSIKSEKHSLRIGYNSLGIKGKQINIYDDMSGSMNVYVGKNWKKDMQKFFYGKSHHLKMDNEPRTLIEFDLYRDGFIYDDDLGRAYDKKESEKGEYTLGEISAESTEFLDKVLTKIKKSPKVKQVELFIEPKKIELTNKLFDDAKFYGYLDNSYRDEDDLIPSLRLLSLSESLPENNKYKDILHDGFVYASINENSNTDTKAYNYGSGFYEDDRYSTFQLNLSNYNSIYILDAGLFDTLKTNWFEKNPTEERITSKLVTEFKMRSSESLVHINDYKGGYEKPILISNRRIWKDELIKVPNNFKK